MKKIFALIQDKLSGRFAAKLVGLRVKVYVYLIDDGNEDTKVKRTKKCFIRRNRKLENYEN